MKDNNKNNNTLYVVIYGDTIGMRSKVFTDGKLANEAFKIYNQFYDYCNLEEQHIIPANASNTVILHMVFTLEVSNRTNHRPDAWYAIVNIVENDTINDFTYLPCGESDWTVQVSKIFNIDDDIAKFKRIVSIEAEDKLMEFLKKNKY